MSIASSKVQSIQGTKCCSHVIKTPNLHAELCLRPFVSITFAENGVILSIVIIGAGPAGLTAAYQLAKAGREVVLLEANSQVGGLSRSITLWDQTVDLGPHRFFSADRKVNEFWLEIVGQNYAMVDRLTRIYYRQQFFSYPLAPFQALRQLGVWEGFRCGISYVSARLANAHETHDDFESWVMGRFGKRLFELFFKDYTEKLWGISCGDLDSDFAAQRIKKLSLGNAIWKGMVGDNKKRHATLLDQFAFPKLGTGWVYEEMARRFQSLGGKLVVNAQVSELKKTTDGWQVTTDSGETFEGEQLISSMPLTHFVRMLPNLPVTVEKALDSLRFRNTVLVYLHLKPNDYFPDNWLYIQESDLELGRVTNFDNWSPELKNGQQPTILALEYWCNTEDERWQRTDKEWSDLAERELVSTGLIDSESTLDSAVIRIPKSYPVYRKGYRDQVAIIRSFLEQHQHLQVIGRYGSFKYNNQDHSILMGLLAAENILETKQTDLWRINSDYTYQEQSIISETGLLIMES